MTDPHALELVAVERLHNDEAEGPARCQRDLGHAAFRIVTANHVQMFSGYPAFQRTQADEQSKAAAAQPVQLIGAQASPDHPSHEQSVPRLSAYP